MVDSPCVGICKLDHNHICMGCKRTIEEVKSWLNLSDEQKQLILNRLFDLENSQ